MPVKNTLMKSITALTAKKSLTAAVYRLSMLVTDWAGALKPILSVSMMNALYL
jgi:hypothetical protein